MRGKRAKLLRKIVSQVGPAKAEIKNQTFIHKDKKKEIVFEIPVTFRYPDNSFQRVYKDMKKFHKKGNSVHA